MERINKQAAGLTLVFFLAVCAVLPFVVAAADAVDARPDVPLEAPVSAVPVEVVSMHDADTLRVNILLPFGVTLRDKSIRAYGYDAWEVTRTRQTVKVTENEIVRGKAAKAALEGLVATGTLYVADSGQSDPYGRVSAWLYVRQKSDGKFIDVAAWMKREGHCRHE